MKCKASEDDDDADGMRWSKDWTIENVTGDHKLKDAFDEKVDEHPNEDQVQNDMNQTDVFLWRTD